MKSPAEAGLRWMTDMPYRPDSLSGLMEHLLGIFSFQTSIFGTVNGIRPRQSLP
jgi:hypothetical protein